MDRLHLAIAGLAIGALVTPAAARPAKIKVTIRTIHGEYGGRAFDDIYAVVESLRPPIAACAARDQKRGRPPERLVGATLTLDPAGAVVGAEIMLGSWPAKKPALERCLDQALRAARFSDSGKPGSIKMQLEIEASSRR